MSTRRAFTLIELIVVIVLLGVLGAIIAPRLTESPARRAEQAARDVRNLLSIAAHRDSLGATRVAIGYDAGANTLTLLSMAGGEWRPDSFAPPAILDGVRLSAASVDGEVLDARGWRFEFPLHQPRGMIELMLESAPDGGRGARRWTVSLLPGATEARSVEGGAMGAGLRSIDLDAAGGGAAPW